jgi:hypothetical protein
MMYRRGIVVRIVLAITLLVVLVGGGIAVYRIGWGQGYQAGTFIPSGEGIESLPVVPQFRSLAQRPFMPGFGFPFFGLCFGIGFIFLVLFLVGGLLKPWGRRRWAGHPHQHDQWDHGPIPPWVKDWEEQYRKSSQDEDEYTETEDDQPTGE